MVLLYVLLLSFLMVMLGSLPVDCWLLKVFIPNTSPTSVVQNKMVGQKMWFITSRTGYFLQPNIVALPLPSDSAEILGRILCPGTPDLHLHLSPVTSTSSAGTLNCGPWPAFQGAALLPFFLLDFHQQ
jgi:hypothetical protein